MAVHRIAVIGGDGSDRFVFVLVFVDQAVRAPRSRPGKTTQPKEWTKSVSTVYYKQHGRMLPEDGWEQLKKYEAIIFAQDQ